MPSRTFLIITLCLQLTGITGATAQIKADCLRLFDSSRHRAIPVGLYLPATATPASHLPVVILSHGYGNKHPESYKAYSYLANYLASQGYFVASIQHEQPEDEAPASTGVFRITRRPNWERGVQNILFVLKELKEIKPALDYSHLVLIGHSNGGDMSMLFATEHPELVSKVISLDNRRMPFPRTSRPRIYSLRSSDQPADDGVLPGPEEQQRYHMQIIRLPHTTHNEMSDLGTGEQHQEINRYISRFLKD